MSKGLLRSQGRAPVGRRGPYTLVIPVVGLAITVAGASGVGFGSAVAGHLPQGNIVILGGVAYLQFAGTGSQANLDANWAGDFSVGTTPAGDGTLSGADVDLVASTELAAATDEVSPRTRGTLATAGAGATLDNTDSSLEVNVNLLIDDANIGANDIPITANGEIHLLVCVLGDD